MCYKQYCMRRTLTDSRRCDFIASICSSGSTATKQSDCHKAIFQTAPHNAESTRELYSQSHSHKSISPLMILCETFVEFKWQLDRKEPHERERAHGEYTNAHCLNVKEMQNRTHKRSIYPPAHTERDCLSKKYTSRQNN